MRDPFDLLTADRPLAPDEQAALDRALAADPAFAADARRLDALGRHVRARLDARLPDPETLVLHALAGVPGALTLDEHARLTAADVPGAIAAHPGLAHAAARAAADRDTFEAAWTAAFPDTPSVPRRAARPAATRPAATRPGATRPAAKRHRPARWIWRTAALAAVASFVAVLVTIQQRDAGWTTVTASTEQTVTLPDGSTALLAAGSQLRVPTDGDDARGARLDHGQALFRVVHDPAAPFTVRTPNAEVTVLGTTFSVNARPTGALTETAVVLVEGAVTLAPRARPEAAVRLAPGTESRVVNLDAPAPPARADVASALAWTGPVVAADEPAASVARRLGERYGVEIVVAEAMAAERVTGTFADGAADAVAKLALALGGEVRREALADGRARFEIVGAR